MYDNDPNIMFIQQIYIYKGKKKEKQRKNNNEVKYSYKGMTLASNAKTNKRMSYGIMFRWFFSKPDEPSAMRNLLPFSLSRFRDELN